jgi:ketosteroid isomerase-like protein
VSEPASARPNAEVIREGFAAFSEGRFEDCLETLDPEVEWHVAFRLPDLPAGAGVMHGHQEVLGLWRQFGAVWDRLVFDPQEILHDSGDTVIARVRIQAIGGESGVELDSTIFYVMTIRNGLLRRIRPFDSPEAAAAAAGVEVAELG